MAVAQQSAASRALRAVGVTEPCQYRQESSIRKAWKFSMIRNNIQHRDERYRQGCRVRVVSGVQIIH